MYITENETNSVAFAQGKQAYKDKIIFEKCPYNSVTERIAFDHWYSGWYTAEDEERYRCYKEAGL
jgi:ribosome modulation factor